MLGVDGTDVWAVCQTCGESRAAQEPSWVQPSFTSFGPTTYPLAGKPSATRKQQPDQRRSFMCLFVPCIQPGLVHSCLSRTLGALPRDIVHSYVNGPTDRDPRTPSSPATYLLRCVWSALDPLNHRCDCRYWPLVFVVPACGGGQALAGRCPALSTLKIDACPTVTGAFLPRLAEGCPSLTQLSADACAGGEKTCPPGVVGVD